MNPPRILLTGSRNWTDEDALLFALNHAAEPLIRARRGPVVLVHGDCPTGADAMADEYWSLRHEIHPDWYAEPERHPAAWKRHGRAAGPLRNREMVALGADVCVAFIRNGSTGATGCAAFAETAGIPVLIYRGDER